MAIAWVHARGNMSIEETDVLIKEVEERILKIDGFASVYTRVGKSGGGSGVAEDVIGTIQFEFRDWQTRRPAKEIVAEVREKTADLAGIHVEVRIPESGPPTGKPIQLHFKSRTPEEIGRAHV